MTVSDEVDGNYPGHRSGSRAAPFDSLTSHVPGAAANAPKRNVLVALTYVLVCLFAAGLLWSML